MFLNAEGELLTQLIGDKLSLLNQLRVDLVGVDLVCGEGSDLAQRLCGVVSGGLRKLQESLGEAFTVVLEPALNPLVPQVFNGALGLIVEVVPLLASILILGH
jgi:hypothetical protein